MALPVATPQFTVPLPEPLRRERAKAVPGHNRWHPGIPAVAEVISGGSVRLECEGLPRGTDVPVLGEPVLGEPVLGEPVLCGPLAVVGAEPGDVIVVDVLGVGRLDGRYGGAGHPGVVGCAPAPGELRHLDGPRAASRADLDQVLLGYLRPGSPAFDRSAAEALTSAERGRRLGGCSIAPLTGGSRILLPVHVRGANLSVGDLHFPVAGADGCGNASLPGWVDLRVNLTKRGVERFRVHGPMLMPDPGSG